MGLEKLPVVDLDNVNHRRRARETINKILNHQFDDSRSQTSAETLAGVTPVNPAWPPGDLRRYGGVGDDSTLNDGPFVAAMAQAAQTGGAAIYVPQGTFRISDDVVFSSNVTVYGDGMFKSVIRQTVADTNHFTLTSISKVLIYDLGFIGTASTATHAGINMAESNDITIERCRFTEMSFIAMKVAGTTSSNNKRIFIRNCYGHDWQASVMPDAGLIGFLDYSMDCEATGNTMVASTAYYNILVQNTSGVANTYCRGIKLNGNITRGTRAYAIVCYRTNLNGEIEDIDIFDNECADIDGAILSGSSGAGIYLQGCRNMRGGRNKYKNTNINTANETLAPGALAINTPRGPHTFIGEQIEDPNWYGVMVVNNSLASSIRVEAQVNGNAKAALYVKEAGSCDFSNSQIVCDSGVKAVSCINTSALSGLNLNSVTITVASVTAPVDLTLIDHVKANGLTIHGTGSGSYIGFQADSCDYVNVGDAVIDMGTGSSGLSFNLANCTYVRVANTTMINDGSSACVGTAGTCTGSNFDKSNQYASNVFSNGGTGCRIEFINSSNPASGTNANGDTRWHPSPATGGSPGAILTGAGWRAMANIA